MGVFGMFAVGKKALLQCLCAFTSPVRTECDMFVMCFMCVCVSRSYIDVLLL